MAHPEHPPKYEPRILDTKGRAQYIDLAYMKQPTRFRDWKRRLMWVLPLAAVAVSLPMLLNVGGAEKAFSNGPVAQSHAIFEQDCAQCHTLTFSSVPDAACENCHDGPAHVSEEIAAKLSVQTERCGECHLEHQGNLSLASVADRHCTVCHSSVGPAGEGLRADASEISSFREGGHPDFPDPSRTDTRPLLLNHAAHMPVEPKKIRNIELPMKCSDCHMTDRASATGDLLPVTFEDHCRKCHEQELQFDVFQLMGADAEPAPHTKDPAAIHNFIVESYQRLLARNPLILQQPIGRGSQTAPNAEVWLATVVEQSEKFLFERKCRYCHEYEGMDGGYPVVKLVNEVRGQYEPQQRRGKPWLDHAAFSHRAHRAVECVSCHRDAAASKLTSDVLIAKMPGCLPCHGSTGTRQDRCSTCHLYHDKSQESDRDRRPIEELIGVLPSDNSAGGS